MTWKVINGNNIDILKTYPDNYFDSIVTDPPYGIEFLGKDWDKNTGSIETWKECLRVLKPGGYLLAFSAARTYHRLATNIEDVGFEIKDQLMWIYASGFPKAQDVGKMIQKKQGKNPYEGKRIKCFDNQITSVDGEHVIGKGNCMFRCAVCKRELATHISKQKPCERNDCPDPWTISNNEWSGWKTALKPAHEPIVMARKPFKGNTVDNVLKYGTGALNIDESRIPYDGPNDKPVPHGGKKRMAEDNNGWHKNNTGFKDIENPEINPDGRYPSNVIGEIPEYQKYFYQPKVSKKERNIGVTDNPPNLLTRPRREDGSVIYKETHPEEWQDAMNTLSRAESSVKGAMDERLKAIDNGEQETPTWNNHPTVKPVELMKYLVRLVTTPNGTVLDPFNGSGSTGMACVELKMNYVGCELDEAYVEIANKRIAAWEKKFDNPTNNLLDFDE